MCLRKYREVYLEKETGFKFNIVKLNIVLCSLVGCMLVGENRWRWSLDCELDNIVFDCRHRRHISFIVVRKRLG